MRYWLYRMEFEEAVVNAVQMKMNLIERPRVFEDVVAAGFGLSSPPLNGNVGGN